MLRGIRLSPPSGSQKFPRRCTNLLESHFGVGFLQLNADMYYPFPAISVLA
jgi:hypothetical protein